MAGLLSMVGVPIGNLSDASPRTVETFAHADVVVCEDTRMTGKLLSCFGVSAPLLRADENKMPKMIEPLLARLQAGEHIAYASDAGMPGISDPGQKLVDVALDAGIRVEVIPGPSAATCALVASGLRIEHFFFEGFLPRSTGAKTKRLEELAPIPGALIIYESPHRVSATLDVIACVMPSRRVALVRELTKAHEEVVRDMAPDLAAAIATRDTIKGECVIIIDEPGAEELAQRSALTQAGQDRCQTLDEAIDAGIADGESASSLAKRLSKHFSHPRADIYMRIVEKTSARDNMA